MGYENKFYKIPDDPDNEINPITLEIRNISSKDVLKTRILGNYIVVDNTYWFWLHRSVARTFCKGYKEGLVVDHINTNKLDNRPENLRWVTMSENMLNPITNERVKNGLKKYYETHDGSNKGKTWSEDICKKISITQKKRFNDNPELKKQISIRQTNKYKDQSNRDNLSRKMKAYYSDPNNRKYVGERTSAAMQEKMKNDPDLRRRIVSGGQSCTKTKWINDGKICKRVKEDKLSLFLNNGWQIGRIKK